MNEQFPQHNSHSAYSPETRSTPGDMEANQEHEPRSNPRIYVTSGLPLRAELTTGTWLDMARSPEDIHAEMFAVFGDDETYEADRLYIWDYHGFGAFEVTTGAIGLEGVDSIELLAQVAQGIAEHGPAYAAYASAHEDDLRRLDQFERAYQGHYESPEAYARELLAPLRLDDALKPLLPASIRDFDCIDYDGIGQGLLAQDDIVVFTADDGGVWVFNESA
ncbi:antirestriction protein ArdA [Nocardia vinacea]|uniref:antirestriction protein ArdA n=1 Tax=Nocardia vinacea TaxID=96468 RepID=UPI0012F6ED9D|nr:antirestriction protein ArdA [Nocardia vinacea]